MVSCMAFDVRDFRLEIVRSLIDAAAENYKENTRINSVIDDKAQKIAGIAGVFLAAALAFLKVDSLSVWPLNRLRILISLTTAIILIICCIAFCLRVMWIRAFPGLPSLSSLSDMSSDLLSIPGAELNLYEEDYWKLRAQGWQEIIRNQESTIGSKSGVLFRAQLALALAMFDIAVLLILILQPLICVHWGLCQ